MADFALIRRAQTQNNVNTLCICKTYFLNLRLNFLRSYTALSILQYNKKSFTFVLFPILCLLLKRILLPFYSKTETNWCLGERKQGDSHQNWSKGWKTNDRWDLSTQKCLDLLPLPNLISLSRFDYQKCLDLLFFQNLPSIFIPDTSLFLFYNFSADTVFLATVSNQSIPVVPTEPIIWDSAPINPGGHFDTTTGGYTAPFNGYYQ